MKISGMLSKENSKNVFIGKESFLLLIPIMILGFIPSINQLFVDILLSGLGSDILNIAGQIEWFDLINETIVAFLITPIYFILNKALRNKEEMKERIGNTFLLGFLLYSIFSVCVFLYANSISAYMNAPAESVQYLQLETIAFIIGFVFSYIYVVLVVHGKWKYFVPLIVIKVAMTITGNMVLIPDYEVLGVAYTNIISNSIMAVVALVLLHKEKLLAKPKWCKETLKEWGRVGMFSGGEIFLNNIIYMIIVVKMINDVSSAGNYWLANNFIWGWLLIPIAALSEIVRRDYEAGYLRVRKYLFFVLLVICAWLISIPLWDNMFENVIAAPDPQAILNIVYLALPFYMVYAINTIFSSIFIATGKTIYNFLVSIIVNIGYYGIVYGLYLAGYFDPTVEFIIMMFGFGMVVCAIVSIILYLYSRNKIIGNLREEVRGECI
ncbi:MAG: hypothetical protein FWF19_02175 [Euryarchaeota archaeon]|nr:hypothetical protein [Euryarchaeota archaeon]